MNAQPTVLKATSSADFLAALPRLTGMTAPESLFLVLFDGSRTLGSARIDLPPAEQMADPGPEISAWVRTVVEIAQKSDAVAVVVQTDVALPESPMSSTYGALTGALANSLRAAGCSVRDALVVASNGWASFVGTSFPELHSLDEITSSPLYDPNFEPITLEDWRTQHPGKTADDPEQIEAMAAQMRAAGSKENRA